MYKLWTCLTGDVPERYLPSGANEDMQAVVQADFTYLIGDTPSIIESAWVPGENQRVAWAVMIGYASDPELPDGADLPMRQSVRMAWRSVLPDGCGYSYIRSAWRAEDDPKVSEFAAQWFGPHSVLAQPRGGR